MREDLYRPVSDTHLFTGELYEYGVSAAAMLCTGEDNTPYYQVAYAVCSPRDLFTREDAEGYTGWRLQSDVDHPYKFRIRLSHSGGISTKRLTRLIETHIRMDVVTQRVALPAIMYRNALRGDYSGMDSFIHHSQKERRDYWEMQKAMSKARRTYKERLKEKRKAMSDEEGKPNQISGDQSGDTQ